MAKIYRLSDKIKVDFGGGLVVTISPLNRVQKQEIQNLVVNGDAIEGAFKAVKYAVKGIEGIEDASGKPYKLKFDDDKTLSEEALEDLFNMEASTKLSTVCVNLLNGVGEYLPEGVTLLGK